MTGDLHFSKVALLLMGNSFEDLSYNDSTVQPGPVALTSAFPGVVASSYWFQRTYTGTPFTVNHPLNAKINADEDFAIEVIAYFQKNKLGGAILSNRTPGGNADGLLIGLDVNSRPFVRVGANGVLKIAIDGPNKIIVDALHTVKVHRKGGIWGLSVDGVPQRDMRHQPRFTGEVPHGPKIYIGCDPYTTGFVGGINGVRMTVGEARQIEAYTPEIVPWPIYSNNANTLFGPLSNNVTKVNSAVILTLDVLNATTVTVAAVDGSGTSVGGGWAVVPNLIAGPNNFKVTGTAPSTLSDYFLVFTGTTTEDFGALSSSESYRIHNTAAGALSEQQTLLAALGGAKLWLDCSDATTALFDGTDVERVVNKIDSIAFTPMLARPKPQLDDAAMAFNCIRFPEDASSGLVAAAPIVLSDASSNSTVVLVGKYVGMQLGQGGGLFQISYTDDDAREDGTAAWVMSTTQAGVNNASVSMYDSTFRQNGIGTAASIEPGEQFIVAWNTAHNKADIWIQQRLMGEVEIAGTLDFWSSVSAAIGFIGGSQTPGGAFVTLGELIALDVDLAQNNNETKLEQLISFLNHKWNIFPKVPYAATPSNLTGYVSNPFAATTIVSDATSITITASSGTDWEINATGSLTPGEYLITGMLPASPTEITITLNSSNGGVPGEDDYVIKVLALPSTPTIQTPLNLQAHAGSGFATLLNIFSADTVSVVGAAGSNWSIALAPANDSGNYIITGTAPEAIGSFTLSVTATKLDEATQLVVMAEAQFTVVVVSNLVVDYDQYPVDLTGLLPSNKIVNEQQTITPANGVKRQLLVPIFAPYFSNSLRMQYYSPGGVKVDAVNGVDYVSVLKQDQLSHLVGSEIYSGVLVLNPELRGSMFLNYQTLGGGFGVDRRSILEELARVASEDFFISWESVTGRPVYFPVSPHTLDIQTHTVGFSGLVSALEGLRSNLGSYIEADVVSLNTHSVVSTNPHNVTKEDFGLNLVQNYPLASTAEATAGTSSQRYLTPQTAYHAIPVHLPPAEDTARGKFYLNLGTKPGDDTDNTKPLTGFGVVSLLIDPQPNAINVLFTSLINQAEQAVQAMPNPLVYPLWWKGIRCATPEAFASAVRSYTGLRALRFKASNGLFYFPVDFDAPSLVTTQSYDGAGTGGSTVMTAVALPLLLA